MFFSSEVAFKGVMHIAVINLAQVVGRRCNLVDLQMEFSLIKPIKQMYFSIKFKVTAFAIAIPLPSRVGQ